MSGVFGVADPSRQTDVRELSDKMMEAMSHREWFVSESYVDQGRSMAIGRIGIGIFNQSPQPIWNEERSVALVMAGESYNVTSVASDQSRLTDEGKALTLYIQYGEDFVHLLEGTFIIAIYDQRSGKVLIVNDRFALYPLFYTFKNGRLIFAPEMKGILCEGAFPRKLDLVALAQYMRFQHLLGGRTFFEDIWLLPQASILIYNLDTASYQIQPYWTFAEIPFRPEIRFEEAAEEAGRLLRGAIHRHTEGPFRPGVFLSGGLDSRTILGMIERRPISSVTYGARDCRDVYYAGRIAGAVGSDHHWFDLGDGEWVIDHVDFHLELTEGFHSWIHAHGISTLPIARELMDVNLTGWGGGTVMGDKDAIESLLIDAVDDLAFFNRLFFKFNQKFTWPSLTEVEERTVFTEPIFRQIKGLAIESFRDELADYLPYRQDVRAEYFYTRNHDARLTHNLVTFYRSHMEVRFPYFDYDLYDFIHSIPAYLRGTRQLHRAVIQRETPRLAYIPYDNDKFLPTTHSLIRGLHGFTVRLKYRVNRHFKTIFRERHTLYADYEKYLRNDLRAWAENILFDLQTTERGIFNPAFLRTLMDRHLSGLEEWTIGKIASIITYEMMLRRFAD